MSTFSSTVRFGSRWSAIAFVLSLGLVAGACSDGSRNMTGPSAIGGTQVKPGPSAQTTYAGTTTVGFENFDASALTVDMVTTTEAVGAPIALIDAGTIKLEILVDDSGNPVPCGESDIWVRFDQAFYDPPHGGPNPSAGVTSLNIDLDGLASKNIAVEGHPGVTVQNAAACESICIRAKYTTGGGQDKVDTHQSLATPYDIPCPSCTYTQGYWKTHGPSPTGNNENEWPADVLATGMMLGTVPYTAAQLQSIFDTEPAGNGLITLAHQLIAAKLNVANGAGDTDVAAAIAAADALIGALVVPPVGAGYLAPAAVGSLVSTLTDYNEGVIGPGHCGG